jgi:glycosyltransferase involved in cell wall biosynthesis
MRSASGKSVEVIVVDASRDRTAEIVRADYPSVRLFSMPAGSLAPELWSRGLSEAKGSAVAFTTGHFVVPHSWLSNLSSALDANTAGAGGSFALDAGGSLVDAAIYFLRYSAFFPRTTTVSEHAPEISSDNSMYQRSALTKYAHAIDGGFWEVELHHALRADGARLAIVPDATILFAKSFPLSVISKHRFAHGKHFGQWRVSTGTSALRIAAASPLVPFALLFRATRRVREARGNSMLLALCSPIFLWLAACWAAGEVAGALGQRPINHAHRS